MNFATLLEAHRFLMLGKYDPGESCSVGILYTENLTIVSEIQISMKAVPSARNPEMHLSFNWLQSDK